MTPKWPAFNIQKTLIYTVRYITKKYRMLITSDSCYYRTVFYPHCLNLYYNPFQTRPMIRMYDNYLRFTITISLS